MLHTVSEQARKSHLPCIYVHVCLTLVLYLSIGREEERGKGERRTGDPVNTRFDVTSLIRYAWSRDWNYQIQVICSLPRQLTYCLVTTLPQQTLPLQQVATAAVAIITTVIVHEKAFFITITPKSKLIAEVNTRQLLWIQPTRKKIPHLITCIALNNQF